MSQRNWYQNPFWYILRVLGQCPIVFSDPVRPSILFCAYNLLFAACFITAYIFGMDRSFLGSLLYWYAYQASLILNLLGTTTILLLPALNVRTFCRIFADLNDVDRIFESLNISRQLRHHEWSVWIITVIYFFFFFLANLLEIIYPGWSLMNLSSYVYFQSFNIFYILVLTIISSLSFFFRLRYVRINRELKALSSSSDTTENQALWMLPTPIYNVNRKRNIPNNIFEAERVRLLQKSHLTLGHGARLLCSYFTLPIIIVLLSTFIELITNFYQTLITLIEFPSYSRQALLNIIKFTLMHLCRIFGMIIPFTTLQAVVGETKLQVHTLYIEAITQEVKQQALMFSLQMTHDTEPFSPWGLFPLDMSLFLSMVGATTTYLVIMVQFSYSADSADKAPPRS